MEALEDDRVGIGSMPLLIHVAHGFNPEHRAFFACILSVMFLSTVIMYDRGPITSRVVWDSIIDATIDNRS
jgi:hypothetical protein